MRIERSADFEAMARVEAEQIVADFAGDRSAEEIDRLAAELAGGLATYDHGEAFGREVVAQLRRLALRARNTGADARSS